MELYMISGTFIGECYECRRGNDFEGYLIEEEASHKLVGEVTINQPSEYDGTRYVFGYKEGNEVAIFQVFRINPDFSVCNTKVFDFAVVNIAEQSVSK